MLTLREAILVEGEDVQTAMRWQDYTQTAIDPGCKQAARPFPRECAGGALPGGEAPL